MRVEFPELKRCCFCMPLRHGLITWGYIRLILALILTALLSYGFKEMIKWHLRYPHMRGFVEDVVMMSLFMIALVVDIAFTISFIIGGHRKSVRLLHIYYIYSLVMLCLDVLFFIGVSIMDIMRIHRFMYYDPDPQMSRYFFFLRARFILGAFLIGIQVYTILLIRSEEDKLRNSSKFRFGNPILNAVDSTENRVNAYPEGDSTEDQQTEAQFEAVIDQTHSVHNESYSYRKF